MGRTEIRGGQIKDDSITGEDIDESTLVLDTLRDADGDTKIQIEESADEDKIRFDTAGVERMIINASGQVGIGTNDPDELLTINAANDGDECFIKFEEAGADRALVGINTSNNLVLQNQYTNKHIVMKVNDNGVTREGFRLNGAVPEVVVNESSDSLVNFRVESDSNTHMLFVTGSGKVGINDSTPTSTLTVQGSLALSVLNINAANDPGSTYTIAATNCVILVNTRPTAEGGIDSAITLTLPDASDNPGMITTVKDAAGYSNVNRIFVIPAGSDKIDGVIDSFQIPAIGGWVKLISDGVSSWAQIGG